MSLTVRTKTLPVQLTAGLQADRAETTNVDAAALAEKLRRRIKGEVRFDDGSRALYATDASNYRQVPIGVVIPRDEEDVIEAIGVARRFAAPEPARRGDQFGRPMLQRCRGARHGGVHASRTGD